MLSRILRKISGRQKSLDYELRGTVKRICTDEGGDIGNVRQLLDAGADINTRYHDGHSVLHCAAYWGHDVCMRMLLAAGADINARNKDGWTPLHQALSEKHYACVRLLIENGADVNRKSHCGSMPLHFAANSFNALQLLIRSGADVNVMDEYGNTPLSEAARHENPEGMKLLIEAGADTIGVMRSAISGGDTGCVQLLIKAGADVNVKDSDGRTALHIAALEHRIDCMKLLIEAGAGLDIKDNVGMTPAICLKISDYEMYIKHIHELRNLSFAVARLSTEDSGEIVCTGFEFDI